MDVDSQSHMVNPYGNLTHPQLYISGLLFSSIEGDEELHGTDEPQKVLCFFWYQGSLLLSCLGWFSHGWKTSH